MLTDHVWLKESPDLYVRESDGLRMEIRRWRGRWGWVAFGQDGARLAGSPMWRYRHLQSAVAAAIDWAMAVSF